MVNKTGKLFRNINTDQVTAFEYVAPFDYYSFVQRKQSEGYLQCILTADIMLCIIEKYLILHNAQILEIEFMVEDEELVQETNGLLSKMKNNSFVWTALKERLHFLSVDNSIDIKRVSIKCAEKSFILDAQVNGMFTVTNQAYNDVATDLCSIVEGQIK